MSLPALYGAKVGIAVQRQEGAGMVDVELGSDKIKDGLAEMLLNFATEMQKQVESAGRHSVDGRSERSILRGMWEQSRTKPGIRARWETIYLSPGEFSLVLPFPNPHLYAAPQ